MCPSRIIGGKWKNKSIRISYKSLPQQNFRPTTSRVRAALFNVILHDLRLPSIKSCNFLDLCCGPGSCGLEAASRGAQFVCMVDKNHTSAMIAALNAENLGMVEKKDYMVLVGDVGKIADFGNKYHIIFIDPPYKDGEKIIKRAVTNLSQSDNLDDRALLICETDLETINISEDWQHVRTDSYSNTFLHYFLREKNTKLIENS